jgi:uncharacterized OB-fold protein
LTTASLGSGIISKKFSGESYVPHPQEKMPVTDLPNPELNPLLNPTLGRNLGRWAEVYFTSPPEKREEAVVELLRELKAQPAPEQTENDAVSKEYVRSNFEASEIAVALAVQCSECGHSYANGQRFCGMCGALLTPEQLSGEDHRLEATVVAGISRAPELRFGYIPDTGPIVAASASLRSAGDGGAEIRWLREKNLAAENAASWSRRAPRYAPAILAVLAIGILIYAQSRPAGPVRPAAPTTAAPVAQKAASDPAQETWSAPTPAPAPMNPAGGARSIASSPVSAPSVGNQAAPDENRAPPSPAPNRGSQPTVVPTSQPLDASSTSNGSLELTQAEDFLNGRKVPRDSAVAAKFLWKAVSKENTSAILLLSDMYLIGDGVPKSCDQARLLLNAAARKNIPQAAQKLRNLRTSGCP